MKACTSSQTDGQATHQPIDRAQRLGNVMLQLMFYAIVLMVVISTLVNSGEKRTPVNIIWLLVGAGLFSAGPWVMERFGAWDHTEGEDASTPASATRKGQLMYLFGYIPIGLFFCSWAMSISNGGFFPVIPLFVLAGFSSSLYSYVGSTLCSVLILLGLQIIFKIGHDFWLGWDNLLGMGAGMVVFNAIFLIANSAVRASRESARLASELEVRNAQLRDYALRAEGLAIAEERNRVAREIHDSLGHALTVINVQIEAARTVLETDRAKALGALEAAQAYTRQGLKDVREAVSSLRSTPLAGRLLHEILPEMLKQAETSGLKTSFSMTGDPRRLPTNLEFTLHRAAQEAITNTIRHAEAAHLDLTLDFSSSDEIRMTLQDDGKGADLGVVNGYGLLGLRERVGHHGGTMSIDTALGKGFTVTITLPLE